MPGFLNQRYLKLPVWAWILLVGGGIGIFLRYRSAGQGDSTDNSGSVDDATGVVPGDATAASGYDPSGFSGFPAYAQPINSQTDGIAATDPYQNIVPDLADILAGQQALIQGLVEGNNTPGAQCGPGTVWDDTKGKCVPVNTPDPGTQPIPGGGGTTPPKPTTPKPGPKKPVPRCSGGQRFDFLRGTCTKCPGGQTYDSSKKRCRTMTHAESVHALSIARNTYGQ